MDLATIIGMLLAWGALIGALLMEGGDVKSLVNLPAALLVFGGTLGAATVSFRMNQIAEIPNILSRVFSEETSSLPEVIALLTRFAERARREGLLSLESESKLINDDFLKRGLRLVTDGIDPETVREMLTTELHFQQMRQREGENIFTTLGGFAPTLGIIGTVMGLIHMLANLSDPAKMGPLIAGAFIATLYGVSSANLIFLPISNKLKSRAADELIVREIMIEGLLAIQAGANPRLVEEKLKAYLAPAQRRLPGRLSVAR